MPILIHKTTDSKILKTLNYWSVNKEVIMMNQPGIPHNANIRTIHDPSLNARIKQIPSLHKISPNKAWISIHLNIQ